MVDEVDDEALDVGAILVLVSHYHEVAVAECFEGSLVGVLLAKLQSQDLYKVHDLLICHQLQGQGGKERVGGGEAKGKDGGRGGGIHHTTLHKPHVYIKTLHHKIRIQAEVTGVLCFDQLFSIGPYIRTYIRTYVPVCG